MNPQGFKDDPNGTSLITEKAQAPDYGYDANGNMIRDDNKGIKTITYNHLNLPTKITFANPNNITYLYNAVGQKVNKVVTENSMVTTTEYLNGYQYVNSVLQFFPHSEGYVKVTGTSYNYVYNYTDHLGNIRLSYSKEPSSNALKVIEENHYYPFGLKHTGYNSDQYYIAPSAGYSTLNYWLIEEVEIKPFKPANFNLSLNYDYKYNGKELQDELGLNVYDYQARNYDPALGRWMNIDPLAELSRRWSPYSYCYNNPMFFVDPDGMFPFPISVRSFAPFKSFGGGFHGDGENRGFTTSATATSRVAQTFTTDPSAGTMSNVKTWSDPSSHPILGSATEKPTGGISDFKQTANKDGSNTVTFNSTMSGANPLVPGSPDIDVKTSFSLTENTKAGTLDVNISQTGDRFPAAETFINDTSGNALFMGVSPYEGNPYTSLPGDNNRQMMSNSFTVTMDDKGVFTGVTQGNQTYTIGEWNKLYQNVDTQKPEVKSFGGGGGFSGGGAGGGW